MRARTSFDGVPHEPACNREIWGRRIVDVQAERGQIEAGERRVVQPHDARERQRETQRLAVELTVPERVHDRVVRPGTEHMAERSYREPAHRLRDLNGHTPDH